MTVLGGVIDPDYDQEWKVILLNTGKEPLVVNVGDRIAQVIFLTTLHTVIGDVETLDSNRVGGLGSTGN
jgi:dUTP pyrophosphatase